MDRLKAFFTRLQQHGIFIDDKRMMASFKFAGNISAGGFAKGDPEEFEEDDDYFYATFRALSMASFPWQGLMLDFSKSGVLKKATKLLQGQTVFTNHDTRVENWLGLVVQSRWDDSTDIPPGINGRTRLNKKWNEKVIDGVREGVINSVSVQVMWDFVKSHPDLPDFYYMQGEEVNGSIVRMIATKIISLDELSLVWQGADPYAKRIAAAKTSNSFSSDPSGEEGEEDPDKDSGSAGEKGSNATNKTNGGNDFMKLSRSMALFFGLILSKFGFGAGIQEVELDAGMQGELLTDLEKAMKTERAANEKKQEVIDGIFGKDFNGDFTEATKKLKLQVAAGEAHLKDVRDEAMKFAKIVEGDALNSALAKSIENASIEDAKAFLEDYKKKAEAKFPVKCGKCGAILTRASAKKDGQETEPEEAVNEEAYKY